MAMTAGASSGGVQSDINVTPMIDVLLVLLIIFMITQPLSRMALDVQVPPPDETVTTKTPPSQIVLELADNGGYSINGQPVPRGQLEVAAAHRAVRARGPASVPARAFGACAGSAAARLWSRWSAAARYLSP